MKHAAELVGLDVNAKALRASLRQLEDLKDGTDRTKTIEGMKVRLRQIEKRIHELRPPETATAAKASAPKTHVAKPRVT